MNKQCVVIFPTYTSLKSYESGALENAIRMTDGFKKVFIAPQSFQFDSTYSDELQSIEVVRFADYFFEGIEGYNSLMLSKEFYDRFSDYEYMLIHQADAYIFKPELVYWCNLGYDYIGAPWYRENKSKSDDMKRWKMKYIPFIYSARKRIEKRYWFMIDEVGNGGFSLRKISTFINVLNNVPEKVLDKYLQIECNTYNEDAFWAMDAPKYVSSYKKPEFKEALRFSIEMGPLACYEILGRELPFGCHAFNKFEPDFWKQFIPFLK